MVDVNKPVTNPELVESMDRFLQNKNAENELLLIERIYHAKLLTPIILNGEIENGVLKKDSTISFKLITNSKDESFIPAFTDWFELQKWSNHQEQTLVSSYEDLKFFVTNAQGDIKGFVINPYNQNIVITPKIMEYFSKRKSEVVLKKDSRIVIGQPANYPHEMVKALIKFFKKHKEVESAYLFQAHKEGDEKPNLLFIIDFKGDKATLFPQVASETQKFLAQDEYIDIIPLNTNLGKSATKNAEPFYKKSKWKFF